MSSKVRQPALGPVGVEIDRRPDGTYYLRSPYPLSPYPTRITERLLHWASTAPDRTFIAERDPARAGQWRRISYGQALAHARSLGQSLLDRGLGPERPLAILSGNDLQHAMLALAALHVGVPFCAVSPAYSLQSNDFGKLRYVLELLRPGLVFAASGRVFERAIAAAVPAGTELVVTSEPLDDRTMSYEQLAATEPTSAVESAYARIVPDTVAKILFTSGSTAQPKGVINTQRMLCSNQQQLLDTMPFLADAPPVFMDWLPWNHTFGGNHNYGLTLFNGGTLYIDDGKPVPALIERTVNNLREIAPTIYFNVPKGFEMLVPYLRADRALRERFFSQLQLNFYAGAHLSQHVRDALDELALATIDERIIMITGLGATETAPSSLFANWDTQRSGLLGLPTYGIELKLAKVDGKLEARVRGPNVMPGYYRQPELTAKAFDEEGFYRFGDALRFLDENDPRKGLLFDGRIAEDFKLSSGTWVSVGPLRSSLIVAAAPLLQDVVVAGHDRGELTALLLLDVIACRALCPELGPEATLEQLASSQTVRARLQVVLDQLALASTGSASRIMRALILTEPPSIDRGEVTDKGTINQRAVLEHRAALVEELYAGRPSSRVIIARAS